MTVTIKAKRNPEFDPQTAKPGDTFLDEDGDIWFRCHGGISGFWCFMTSDGVLGVDGSPESHHLRPCDLKIEAVLR